MIKYVWKNLFDFRIKAIFVFDEMSASLDKETFMRIWNKVDLYLKDKIRIYIEHDMSIKDSVDRTILIDRGTIIGN